MDLFVILWPGGLFVLHSAGVISNSVYGELWLSIAETSGLLVVVSLALILVGIWRRESAMGMRTSQLFVYLSGFAIFAWVIFALFAGVVEEQAATDCLLYYPYACTPVPGAEVYAQFYVVPSLAVSFVILLLGIWNLAVLKDRW
jgi:hypothetical protein